MSLEVSQKNLATVHLNISNLKFKTQENFAKINACIGVRQRKTKIYIWKTYFITFFQKN